MMPDKLHWIQQLTERDGNHVPFDGSSSYAGGTVANFVRGVVRSQSAGLLRAGVRIRIMQRTDLRARWPIEQGRFFVIGQPVTATIPAEAVRLEAGIFRRSRQRWNRWVGRIVLIEHLEAGIVVTVKLHGEEWTLKSLGPVLGAQQPLKSWDIVNVVVDPQMVEIAIAAPCLVARHT